MTSFVKNLQNDLMTLELETLLLRLFKESIKQIASLEPFKPFKQETDYLKITYDSYISFKGRLYCQVELFLGNCLGATLIVIIDSDGHIHERNFTIHSEDVLSEKTIFNIKNFIIKNGVL